MEKYLKFQGIVTLFIFLRCSVAKGFSQPELLLSKYRSHQPYVPLNNFETKGQNSPAYNDIELSIKSIYPHTSNLNKLIKRMFNLTNSNYEYIFDFPGKFSKKLIMHRNDFEDPIFPNLTKPYIQMAQISRRMDEFNSLNQVPKKSPKKPSLLQIPDANLFVEELDDELPSTVMANVVNEGKFINYMKNLNNKGEKFMKKLYQHNTFTPPLPPNKMKKMAKKIAKNWKINPNIKSNGAPYSERIDNLGIEWSTLGLDGWEGALVAPKYIETSNRNPTIGPEINIMDSKKNPNYNIKLPIQYNFLDKNENNTIWDLPGKVSSKQPLLKELIESTKNDETLTHLTKLSVSTPNWPITVKRNEHNLGDVYIARANDPFGHSTKWETIKNNTESDGKYTRGNRSKRSILNLYSMIKCSTGCDPIIYKGYGCFCGFMGNGVPVDGIDRCCHLHDKCYGTTNCPSHLTYFVPYLWKCYSGKPICATSHGEWGGPNSCAANLCKCDLELSRCLRKYICPNRRAVCRTSKVRLLQNYLMIL